jgi:arsenate reductase
MPSYAYNVLFLCTRNSARSILAEGILRRDGAGRFRAYSAEPKGTVHCQQGSRRLGTPANGYHSKSWDQFEKPGAPPLDFVITVRDSAAGDLSGRAGHPATAHWGSRIRPRRETEIEKERLRRPQST